MSDEEMALIKLAEKQADSGILREILALAAECIIAGGRTAHRRRMRRALTPAGESA